MFLTQSYQLKTMNCPFSYEDGYEWNSYFFREDQEFGFRLLF